jgi:hypothetical protein
MRAGDSLLVAADQLFKFTSAAFAQIFVKRHIYSTSHGNIHINQ